MPAAAWRRAWIARGSGARSRNRRILLPSARGPRRRAPRPRGVWSWTLTYPGDAEVLLEGLTDRGQLPGGGVVVLRRERSHVRARRPPADLDARARRGERRDWLAGREHRPECLAGRGDLLG